jgi:(1->4)-alpha-D-glucan 1-alpha-D-glucosylmutase
VSGGPALAAPEPTATYRLQLQRGFGFREATRLVPYLARLGVSHVYCSPYLRARAGSTHGYDITDHASLNPEIGDEADFSAFVDALHRHGMGQILDFVPNHMGVAQADNAWWLDVLEYGRASAWADFFDIDWRPAQAALRGKVLAPFLGDHYGRELEAGKLRLAFDPEAGSLSVWYHDHRFPVSPREMPRVLGSRLEALAEALGSDHPTLAAVERVLADLARGPRAGEAAGRRAAARERTESAKRALAGLAREAAVRRWIDSAVALWNGEPGRPETWRRLHRLLETQHYRLAFWRVASDEINYRRFFNVNELAGLRMERPEVFERTHWRVLQWIAEGRLEGLRIDHVDGLLDPKGYCDRLRAHLAGRPLYLVVEKILAHHESVRGDWPVDGTTGYEFLNLVGGLFVDPAGEAALERTWRRFAPGAASFEDEVYACKKHVMNFLLEGELQVLAHALDRLSEAHWSTRDFTGTSLREALKEVVACFPVYRTYLRDEGAAPEDRRDVDWAVAHARRRSSDPEPTLFDWIHGMLTTDVLTEAPNAWPRREVLDFVMRFQQLTGPVMAKALEDTAFYRTLRLSSLNEVGGDPRRFGVSPAAFQRANAERLRHWSRAMLTTATHDTKRGEDTRLRIHVLSELADEWERRARRWALWNRRWKRVREGVPEPAPDDEYLLYQTLLGSWPEADGIPPGPETRWLPGWCARLEAYALKAVREAKRRTSWRHPNAEYEASHLAFLRALLDVERPNPFLVDLATFAARVAEVAAWHGLSQVALKLASPGVPDTYQGCELWDLSLADPDNRRPVDFAHRVEAFEALEARLARGGEAARATLEELLTGWRDGRIKLLLTARLLGLRRRRPALFLEGDYIPLAAEGTQADRIVAFARSTPIAGLAVVAPRLVAPLVEPGAGLRTPAGAWADTVVRWPEGSEARVWRDLMTGAEHRPGKDGEEPILPVSALLADFPVAVLVAEPPSSGLDRILP